MQTISSPAKRSRDGQPWSRDELVLAFDLYCRIPFKKTKSTNPEVIALAKILRRTPASVARKLGNFGSFDPELKKKNISGLSHTGKLDKHVWDEFNSDWNELVLEADQIRRRHCEPTLQEELYAPDNNSPTERMVMAKQRIHQDFFRIAVLSGYNYRCCMCGLPHLEILTASHIIPWSIRIDTRVNPQNGLCFCATHDRAFDCGLLGVTNDFRIILGERLRQADDAATRSFFKSYESKRISLPERFLPRAEFLEWHRANVFSRSTDGCLEARPSDD